MTSLRSGAILLAIAMAAAALPACHVTVLPTPDPAADSLAPESRRVPPLRRAGDDVDTVTVIRVDTVRVLRVDTVRVRVPARRTRADTVVRVDTVIRVDTVRVRIPVGRPRADTVVRVDTIRVPVVDTVRQTVARTDTVVRVDTVRVAVTDTVVRVDSVRVAVVDTLLVAGRRMMFVPPGHYPPEGQCRVWIHDRPPGQQADAAPCDELGAIPGGAFILFGGEAWDFDYDWVWEADRNPGSVPPEIVAVKRRGSG